MNIETKKKVGEKIRYYDQYGRLQYEEVDCIMVTVRENNMFIVYITKNDDMVNESQILPEVLE